MLGVPLWDSMGAGGGDWCESCILEGMLVCWPKGPGLLAGGERKLRSSCIDPGGCDGAELVMKDDVAEGCRYSGADL